MEDEMNSMKAVLVGPLKMENIGHKNNMLMKNCKKVEGFSF
jgi:hypothetical protein